MYIGALFGKIAQRILQGRRRRRRRREVVAAAAGAAAGAAARAAARYPCDGGAGADARGQAAK